MLYGLQDCCEWVANSALVFLAENNCSHCHEQLCNLYLWNDVKKKKRSTCCLLAFVNTRTRRGQHESLGFLKSCGRDCAPQSVFSGPAAAAASPGRDFNVQTPTQTCQIRSRILTSSPKDAESSFRTIDQWHSGSYTVLFWHKCI